MSDVAELRDGIAIGPYEDWMRDQVVDMIVAQYGSQRDAQRIHSLAISTKFQQKDALIQARDGVRLDFIRLFVTLECFFILLQGPETIPLSYPCLSGCRIQRKRRLRLSWSANRSRCP